MNTNIIIITGLPGSGKTTLAEKLYKDITNKNDKCILIALDKYQENTFDEIMADKILNTHNSNNIIIEGLLLENNILVDCLYAVKKYINNDVKVIIHYFNEDRQTCIYNDIGRREKSSRITIENALYEIPDSKYIKKQLNIDCKIIKHTVVKKSNYDMFCDVNKIYDKNMLTSSSWSLGGTYGSCYSDSLSPIMPDTPRDFIEFDELLERICPQITFLHYNKLKRECNTIVEYSEHDYYGGLEYLAYHKCDLRKLYDLLVEMGYIK